jgi:hypothetical protein
MAPQAKKKLAAFLHLLKFNIFDEGIKRIKDVLFIFLGERGNIVEAL